MTELLGGDGMMGLFSTRREWKDETMCGAPFSTPSWRGVH